MKGELSGVVGDVDKLLLRVCRRTGSLGVATAAGRLLKNANSNLLSVNLLNDSLVCDHETMVFFRCFIFSAQ